MTAAQGDMWKRFYQRFPFDPESLYYAPPASIAACIVNAHGGRDGRAVSVRDMLLVKPPEKPESLDQKMRRIFERMPKNPKPA